MSEIDLCAEFEQPGVERGGRQQPPIRPRTSGWPEDGAPVQQIVNVEIDLKPAPLDPETNVTV
jgi:hypothetical protein